MVCTLGLSPNLGRRSRRTRARANPAEIGTIERSAMRTRAARSTACWIPRCIHIAARDVSMNEMTRGFFVWPTSRWMPRPDRAAARATPAGNVRSSETKDLCSEQHSTHSSSYTTILQNRRGGTFTRSSEHERSRVDINARARSRMIVNERGASVLYRFTTKIALNLSTPRIRRSYAS